MHRLLSPCLTALFILPALIANAAPLTGDSLVLAGTTPGTLCFDQVTPGTFHLRSTYDPKAPGSIAYEEGRDYTLDLQAGTLARTADSRIPDFATNVLFGQKSFDHSKFPGYGNNAFFVFADYESKNAYPFATPSDQSALLKRTREKLEAGGPFKIITYGDSISAGGEASALELRFDERYAAHLRARYPNAVITVENGATGGDSTVNGLARLGEKVLTRSPDLVLIGFGMNDHNVNGVLPGTFEENLVQIVTLIRANTSAEVLLHSCFPPNPDWMHSSHRMEQYAAASQRAAARVNAAFADVHAVWQKVLQRKDLPSLLANNINHPNDFGHALYFEALASVHFGKN
jgi:acyl-CoA thioesterase-1